MRARSRSDPGSAGRPFLTGHRPGGAHALLWPAGLLAACAAQSGNDEVKTVPSRSIEAVLADHTDSLMALPGVVGTAIGRCDGAPCIRVFLADSNALRRLSLPLRLEGHPVQAEVSGPVRPRGAEGR